MSGVGKKSTVLVPVPEPAGAMLAKHCNQLWNEAKPIASTASTLAERTEAPQVFCRSYTGCGSRVRVA